MTGELLEHPDKGVAFALHHDRRDNLKRLEAKGSQLHLAAKALAEGEALGVDMKVCDQVRKMFRAAIDAGMGKQDITSIVKCIEQQAGVEIPKVR